ncbi:MAG: iron-containing alcohol dehydrogenase [Candidatus Hydrogenedentes bacterium]|nr:iron-containing alcohol dehydrogenase [Candidatus Hydrogenedentota bacterium]
MEAASYNFPTRMIFGPGTRAQLGDLLKAEGKSRPLIVTDKGIAGLPFLGEMSDDLKAGGLEPAVYSAIFGNPVKSQVVSGVEAYRAHNADSLIILGGGAALDVGKVIALMINHPGDVFDYEDGNPDMPPVDKDIPFNICVPTTAGTGSEVGRSSVISDDETHVKRIIFDPRMMPPLVVADPELTIGLPAGVTAATGVDALSHSVEAYLSKGYHPMADGIALEGIRMVKDNLQTAVETPTDIVARGNMLMASTMGATAFQKGLGVTHSCAHALSAVCDLHHGLAIALMLPACMRFNASTVPERMDRLKYAVDTEQPFDQWLEAFNKAVNLPGGLGEVGVKEEHIAKLVDIAIVDVCHPCNPRAVSREDFEALFKEAL